VVQNRGAPKHSLAEGHQVLEEPLVILARAHNEPPTQVGLKVSGELEAGLGAHVGVQEDHFAVRSRLDHCVGDELLDAERATAGA
jgi:hypothetical protein